MIGSYVILDRPEKCCLEHLNSLPDKASQSIFTAMILYMRVRMHYCSELYWRQGPWGACQKNEQHQQILPTRKNTMLGHILASSIELVLTWCMNHYDLQFSGFKVYKASFVVKMGPQTFQNFLHRG